MKHMHVVTAAPGTDWLVATGRRTIGLPASSCAIHVVRPWLSRADGPIGSKGSKNTNCWEVKQEDCCLSEPDVRWASLLPEEWDHTGNMLSHALRKLHILFRIAAKFLGVMILCSSLTLIPCLLWILFSTLSYNCGFILALFCLNQLQIAPFFFFFHMKTTHWRPLWGWLNLLVIWVIGSLLHSASAISNEM